MDNRDVVVRAEWDAEAGVYVATSDDVPGLVAEAPTLVALLDKLRKLVPHLLELNASDGDDVRADASRLVH